MHRGAKSVPINTGWLRTVMSERGIRAADHERVRQLVSRLSEAETTALAEATRKLAGGSSDGEALNLVSNLASATSDSTREALARCGAQDARPEDVYRWLLVSEASMIKLMKGGRGDEGIASEVKEHFDLLKQEASGTEGRQAESALEREGSRRRDDGASKGSPGHEQGPKERKRRGTRSEPAVERRGGFARDDEIVKRMAASKHAVHKSKGALTFEVDYLSTPEAGRRFTVRVEAARREVANGGFNWEDKIIIQLTASELHKAAAVVLGMRSEFKESNHGPARDKRIELRAQEGGVAVVVGQGKEAIAVPVEDEDLFKVGLLFTRALTANEPDLDPRVVLDVLRLTNSTGKKR